MKSDRINACINCGEAHDGGYTSGWEGHINEGAVGPFCSQCWEFLRETFQPPPPPLAASPVPCAASPADTVAEITAILDDFAPLHDGETKTLPQRLRDEIHDFQMVMDHCSEVYMYFSGGAISKQNTLPREVITLADDLETERTNEAIAEAREEWEAARATGEGARDATSNSVSRREGPRAEQPEVFRELLPADSGRAGTGGAGVRTDDQHRPDDHQTKAAPVAVSLDPHRLLKLATQALDQAEIAKAFLHQSGTDPEAWLDGVIDSLFEIIARLRGEATVRPVGE